MTTWKDKRLRLDWAYTIKTILAISMLQKDSKTMTPKKRIYNPVTKSFYPVKQHKIRRKTKVHSMFRKK